MNSKKLFYIALALLLITISGVAFAASQTGTVYSADKASPYTSLITMTTTTDNSDSAAIGVGTTTTAISIPMSHWTCQLLYSGTTPSTSTVTFEGSIDGGTTWQALASALTTTLSTGNFINDTTIPASQIRMNWSAISSGTGTANPVTATGKCRGRQ